MWMQQFPSAASMAEFPIKQYLSRSYVTSVSVSTDTPPRLFMQYVTAQYPMSDRPVFCSGADLSETRSLTYLPAPPPKHPL